MSAGPDYTPEQLTFVEGQMVLIDKPLEWTSFDVVNKMRGSLKYRLQIRKIKVGHAGTLDPLATGLLVICIGRFTKKINDLQSDEKEYTGTITFGGTTPSYDLETEIDQEYAYDHITPEKLQEAVGQLSGFIEQVPPVYSAINIDGKRAYDQARKGKEVKMKARTVEIKEFEITRFELPQIDFRIVCSKGTYIRSIAHDIGQLLDSGSHLSALRRTRSGVYKVEDALQVQDWVDTLPDRKD